MLCIMDELKHFSKNDLSTPVTPNDPRLTFDPIKEEGHKLMHTYESYGQAM